MDTTIMSLIIGSDFYKWLRIFKVPTGPATGGVTVNTGTGLSGGGFIPIGGEITIEATGLPTAWVEVTGTTQAMATDTAYATNNAGLVTLTLPALANIGDYLEVWGKGAGGWQINQNAGQKIIVGQSTSTIGVTGSVASTYQSDIIIMRCITANNVWSGYCPSGDLSVS